MLQIGRLFIADSNDQKVTKMFSTNNKDKYPREWCDYTIERSSDLYQYICKSFAKEVRDGDEDIPCFYQFDADVSFRYTVFKKDDSGQTIRTLFQVDNAQTNACDNNAAASFSVSTKVRFFIPQSQQMISLFFSTCFDPSIKNNEGQSI